MKRQAELVSMDDEELADRVRSALQLGRRPRCADSTLVRLASNLGCLGGTRPNCDAAGKRQHENDDDSFHHIL
jgi:hypothetical protein